LNDEGPTVDGPPTLDDDDDGEIEAKAGIITQIMVPVCITMALVIAIVKSISLQDSVSQAMVYMENPNYDSTTSNDYSSHSFICCFV